MNSHIPEKPMNLIYPLLLLLLLSAQTWKFLSRWLLVSALNKDRSDSDSSRGRDRNQSETPASLGGAERRPATASPSCALPEARRVHRTRDTGMGSW